VAKAPFPRVTGLTDAALAARVNTALREPLDWQIGVYQKWITDTHDPECVANGSKLEVQTTLGLKGPELVSVRYQFLQDTRCWEPGTFDEAVTVDLRTGRAFTPAEIFKPEAYKALNRTIGGRWVKKQNCDDSPAITKAMLETRNGLSGTDAELLFTEAGLVVTAGITTAAGCVATATVPYASIRAQFRDGFLARLPQ
jgi:hypothetical protein